MEFLSHDFLMALPGFLMLGAVAGFCAGLLGIGGGIILVPGLYFLLKHFGPAQEGADLLMHIALATSMAIILPTGISSSLAQIKRKAVDFKAAQLLAPGLVIGVVSGLFLVSYFDGNVLKLIFAIGLYGVAISVAFRREDAPVYPVLNRRAMAYPFSALFGVAATFLGMGGAVLNVPYLVRAGLPLKNAIATGSFLGVIVSVTATLGNILQSEFGGGEWLINLTAVALIIPASILMAPLGVRASHALPVHKLKLIFALLLMAVASKMLMDAV